MIFVNANTHLKGHFGQSWRTFSQSNMNGTNIMRIVNWFYRNVHCTIFFLFSHLFVCCRYSCLCCRCSINSSGINIVHFQFKTIPFIFVFLCAFFTFFVDCWFYCFFVARSNINASVLFSHKRRTKTVQSKAGKWRKIHVV